jgi:anti-sigma regulatory factor (Ser/Thr protein kinase)
MPPDRDRLPQEPRGARQERDAPSLCISLERDPKAPSLARAAVVGFAEECRLATAEPDVVRLLVSELVTNAVLHSDAPPRSEIVLRARLLERNALRVEVIDRGSGFDAATRGQPRPTGGYGLLLVAKQASRWGVDQQGGTRVWFELAGAGRARPA